MARKDEYGWIVDENHPIRPKFTKEHLFDIGIGVGAIILGVVQIVVTSFKNGAHAYETSEFDILNETGHIRLNESSGESTVDVDPYDGFTNID